MPNRLSVTIEWPKQARRHAKGAIVVVAVIFVLLVDGTTLAQALVAAAGAVRR